MLRRWTKPLALIWFGLGDGSVVFVLIHAVLWAVALNTGGYPTPLTLVSQSVRQAS